MKRRLVLLPILGLLLGACAPGVPESVTVSSVSGETTIEVGETLQLSAQVLPSSAAQDVTWSTGNPAIATVSTTGLVTGVAEGSVQIRAGVTADITGSITITVEDNTPTPPPSEGTIGDILAEAAIGDVVTVKGVVVSLNNNGMLISDNTGAIYMNDRDLKETWQVNDYVEVNGKLSEYPTGSGLLQFNYKDEPTVTAATGTAPTITDTPATMTGAEMDAWVPSNEDKPLVTISGSLSVSGNYYNVTVEGATKTLSVLPNPSMTLNSGSTYEFTGYLLYITNDKYVNMTLTDAVETGGGDVPPVGEVVTIAEAIAEGVGANVVVEGVIIAKTADGMLIADETGTLYRHDYDTETVVTQPVGGLVRISGALSEYPTGSGIMQFNYEATVTAGEGETPVISDTPVVWDGAAVDGYTNQARAILVTVDAHVTSTANKYGGYDYTATVDGATKTIELSMPSAVTLTTGDYKVTGYVNYTRTNSSGQNVVNMLYVSHEGEGGGGVPPTPTEVTPIADAHGLADDTAVEIEGVLVANTASGLVIDDNTGTMYVYQGTTDLPLNSFVHVEGTLGTHNNVRQIANATVTAATGTAPVLTNTTPTPMTGAEFDAWTPSGTRATLVSLTATITSTGRYTNADVEGATEKTLSPMVPTGVTAQEGTTYDMVGYLLYISGGRYIYMACVSMEEATLSNPTAVEITNTETTLMEGNTLQLNLAWTPSLVNDEVSWTSSSDEIATVSETGLVTAVAAGEVDITVTSTVVSTVTDTIHLTITAAAASELLVEMDFSSLATSKEMDATTLQQVLLDNVTTINDPELTVAVTNTAKVYSGGAGGYHSSGSTGYLKFGASKAQGIIDVTLNREIVRVEIDCVKWNDSAKDTFAINGIAQDGPAAKTAGTTTLTAEEFGTLSWNLDATTDLSLVVTNRGYVAAIRLYVAAA